jgi:hypothetical protein
MDRISAVRRELGYYKGAPAMVLKPGVRDNGKRFIIKIDDLWKYSDTHNPQFEEFIVNKVVQLCQLFEINVPKGEVLFVQLMASIADTIMAGIDEVVKMTPYREGHDDPNTVLGRPEPLKEGEEPPELRVRMMQ